MQLRRVRAVARKEFLHLLRDFRSLALAFMIPVLLILLFGYALSLDVTDVKTGVWDQDRTPLTRALITRLNASAYFKVVAYCDSPATVNEDLDRGATSMTLVIPKGFSADLTADRPAALQVLIDGTDPNFAGISRGYITGFIARLNQERLAAFLNRGGLSAVATPVDARIRVWFNEELESRNFIVPGIIAIIIMISGAMLTSLVIAREYESGTMESVLCLPLTAGEFLLGKAAPYFMIAMTNVLLAIFMGQVLFDVVMKASFWSMLLASTLYIAVALSLGLFISIKTKSQLVANQAAILVTYLPSLLLSDFVFPVQNMPFVLQQVTRIVPATYYIDILNGLYLRNLGPTTLWPSFLVLFGMALILARLNLAALKKEGL